MVEFLDDLKVDGKVTIRRTKEAEVPITTEKGDLTPKEYVDEELDKVHDDVAGRIDALSAKHEVEFGKLTEKDNALSESISALDSAKLSKTDAESTYATIEGLNQEINTRKASDDLLEEEIDKKANKTTVDELAKSTTDSIAVLSKVVSDNVEALSEEIEKRAVKEDVEKGLTDVTEALTAEIVKKQDILSAGDNITITGTTISAKDTTYGTVTGEVAGLMSAEDKTKLDGVESGAQVNVIESISIDGTVQSIKDKACTLNLSNYATKKDLSDSLTSALVYKGSKETKADLPSEGNKRGDVWNVMDTDMNYAWNGEMWDQLGSSVDLAPYATKEYANQRIEELAVTKDDVVSSVTGGSASPVTSGAVHSELQKKQDKLTSGDFVSIDETSRISVDLSSKQDKLTAGKNISIEGATISATDTTYDVVSQSASGLMSAEDKTKLDGVEREANKTVVESTLSDTSVNPVQSKVIHAELSKKLDKADGIAYGANRDGKGAIISDTYARKDSAIANLSVSGTSITATDVDGKTICTISTQDTDTDTTNTAGATESSEKLYIIGAKTQTEEPQTYSHSGAYIEGGKLYSGGEGVLTITSVPENAKKAECDDRGNVIVNTYATKAEAIKSLSVDERVITYTKVDGSTGSITTQDTTYSPATSATPGLMSSTDKTKLDSISAGAQVNVIEAIQIKDGAVQTLEDKVCTLDLGAYAKKEDLSAVYRVKGSVSTVGGLPTSGNTVGDVYNVSETGANYVWTEEGVWDSLGAVYSVATSEADGLMSKDDKAALDNLVAGNVKIEVDSEISSTSENPVQNKVIHSALGGKSDVGHDHDGTYAPTAHEHDGRYYTEEEIDVLLANKEPVIELDGNKVLVSSETGKVFASSITTTELGYLSGMDQNIKSLINSQKVTVDSSLSGTSVNPVQNKVIHSELTKYFPKTGGTIEGNIEVNGTTSLGGNVTLTGSGTPLIIGSNGKIGLRAKGTTVNNAGQINISDSWYGGSRWGAQISAYDGVENEYNQLRVSHEGLQYLVYDNATGSESAKQVALVDDIPDTSNLATKAEIPNISGLATKTELSSGLNSKQDNITISDSLPSGGEEGDVWVVYGQGPSGGGNSGGSGSGSTLVPISSLDETQMMSIGDELFFRELGGDMYVVYGSVFVVIAIDSDGTHHMAGTGVIYKTGMLGGGSMRVVTSISILGNSISYRYFDFYNTGTGTDTMVVDTIADAYVRLHS